MKPTAPRCWKPCFNDYPCEKMRARYGSAGPGAFISAVAYFLTRTPLGISIRAKGQRGQFVLLITVRSKPSGRRESLVTEILARNAADLMVRFRRQWNKNAYAVTAYNGTHVIVKLNNAILTYHHLSSVALLNICAKLKGLGNCAWQWKTFRIASSKFCWGFYFSLINFNCKLPLPNPPTHPN